MEKQFMRVEAPTSDSKRGLDRVLDVVAVHDFVDAHALLANGVKECGSIAVQNFADRGIAEHGVQFANASAEFIRRTPAAGVLNGLNGLANTVDGISNGVWKVAIEQEKFEDTVGSEIGCINLAVGFERRTTTQEPDLLKILVARVFAFMRTGKQRLVDLEERSDSVGAFEVASESNEVPALAMDHRCIADALEQMDGVDEGRQHIVDIGTELGFGVRRVHEMIKAVEALPLLGGDFFADLAGVF